MTKIESEREEEIKIEKGNFPKEGKIEFINYRTKYHPFTSIVLDNINLIINPCDKKVLLIEQEVVNQVLF